MIKINTISDDDVFKETLMLAVQRRLSGVECIELVTKIKKIGTSKKQMDFIHNEKDKIEHRERLTEKLPVPKKILFLLSMMVGQSNKIEVMNIGIIPDELKKEYLDCIDSISKSMNRLKKELE
jgi:hypothetical protein